MREQMVRETVLKIFHCYVSSSVLFNNT